jgi:hypothetical protein
MSLAKKLKMIVKGEPKPTFGTDPNEPWSARAGITESESGFLSSYLKSRGINPEFVSRDTKISHAKSAEFSKWKRDHRFDDPADTVSSVARDKMKAQREEVQFDEAKTIQGTALDKFRQAAAERARKHDDIEREMKARHAAGKEDMKGAIDRLEKHLNKEESGEFIKNVKKKVAAAKADRYTHYSKTSKDMPNTSDTYAQMAKHQKKLSQEESEVNEADQKFIDSLNKLAKTHKVGDSVTVNSKFFGKQKGKVTKVDNQSVHVVRDGKSSAEKYPHDAVVKESAGVSKTKETSFHKKLDKLVHSTFGKRKDEEVPWVIEDVVTEKNDSHTHAAHYEDPKTGEWTGMNLLIAKDDEDAIRQANEKCKEGCRLTKVERHITVKEEVEQIDEITKSDYISAVRKTKDPNFSDDESGPGYNSGREKIINRAEKHQGKKFADKLRKDNYWREFGLHKGVRKGMKRYGNDGKSHPITKDTYKEDVFQDPQAATQTAFDMGTQADDREPTYSRKKEMSKSARMIKALYKKHKMVKEELYDHEKEDKSVATYGRKPKVEKVQVDGDENNQAAMVLKGGKTLTGQTRDTLEIDPVMRKPSSSEIKNSSTKTDK